MGNFLLLLILFVLASVLLLIVYLIDRVNLIEKQTVDRAATELKNNNASGPFRGMEGEDLWNAMSYNRMPPLEESIIEEIKPRYEFILLKHVEKTFELGKDHALKNIETKPVNQITLPTLRGPVESWIPQNFCEEIYNAGFENISILDIARMIKERIGCDIVVTESNDPRSYRLDSTKLLNTGFSPQKTVNHAITEIIDAYQQGKLDDQAHFHNLAWMKQNEFAEKVANS